MESSHFSSLINDFKPGIFGALNERKEELLRAGRKVYNLSVGTPDFRPAPHVMKAMQEACGKAENYKYSCRSFLRQCSTVMKKDSEYISGRMK